MLLTYVVLFSIASVLISLPLLVSGFNPIDVYKGLLYGGFGSIQALSRSLMRTATLLFCGLGVLVAYRAGVWNIGAEGQLYMGAVGVALVGLFIQGIPTPIHLVLVVCGGLVGGGLWAGIAGLLKVRFRANEIIVTLLMNFIAYWIVYYLVRFVLKARSTLNPVTEPIATTARLPVIIEGTSLHAGILIALGFSAVVWILLSRTVFGYRNKAVGSNPEAALYGGISANKVVIVSMLLSGGIAGLAGMCEVAGFHYRLADNISMNYGYYGIPIAIIGKLHPVGVVLGSLFLGGLLTGSRYVQVALGVPSPIVFMIMSIFIIVVILEEYIKKALVSVLRL